MIIQARGYMQTRSLEAGLAFIMLAVGLQLLRPGDTFSAPPYTVLRTYVSEDHAGQIFVGVGLLRMIALFRNGRWHSSPLVRLAGCSIGTGFWFTLATALAQAEYGVPALLPIIAGAVTGLEFYSGLRTGFDIDTLDSLGIRRLGLRRRNRARMLSHERENAARAEARASAEAHGVD